MPRYYGIFTKGTANTEEMLNLTLMFGFERTSNLKSDKLYYLKEIIKLTSKFSNECEFKYALFRNGIIGLDDITKELSVRSNGDGVKAGKNRMPLIYNPSLDLFRPSVLRAKYIEKFDVQENYHFLKELVNKYSGHHIIQDKSRYTSEVIIDEINSIIMNYNPNSNFDNNHIEYYSNNKEYFNNRIKALLEDFINYEVFYVIDRTPNSADRKMSNIYRKGKDSKKIIDFYSLYKLVVFYIYKSNDPSLVNGIASSEELQDLKIRIINEIEESKRAQRKYEEEAVLLAEEDIKMFSSQYDEERAKPKSKARKKQIEGQSFFNL